MTNPLSYTGITQDNVGYFSRELLDRSIREMPQLEARRLRHDFRSMQESLMQRLAAGLGVPREILGTSVPVHNTDGSVLGHHLINSWGPNTERSPRAICRQLDSFEEVQSALLVGFPVVVSQPRRAEDVFVAEHMNEPWRPEPDRPMTAGEQRRAERESPVRPRDYDEEDALEFAVRGAQMMSDVAQPVEQTGGHAVSFAGLLYDPPPGTQPSTVEPTPYQAKLLELKPLPSDVWGNATDPHDWHVVMFWATDHVEFGDYQDEYPKSFNTMEFRNKILDDGWELVYRHPEQPGAELARLNIRSINEITQAPPVQRNRRALRLRQQEHEVTDDQWYQNSTEQDLRSLGAAE